MAINIEWQALSTPHDEKGKQPQLYLRLVDNEVADFLKTHDSITRSETEKFYNMEYKTDCAHLNGFAKFWGLRKVGYNKETKYKIIRGILSYKK